MKARIKATGEIINIADYETITFNKCGNWNNTIKVRPEDIELIGDITENEHWQDVRERAAIAAMQGLLVNSWSGDSKYYATAAVKIADALVKQLKGK